MGEARREALRVGFDHSIKPAFRGAKVSSDGRLVTYHELDEVLQLTAMATEALPDSRTGDNIQHDLMALLRQSVFSRLAGYKDTNNAERLRVDPTMRVIVGGRAKKRLAASTSQMTRFETEVLTRASVQPRELPAAVGVAFGREALVADDASEQADQDRGEDRSASPVRHVSDGRGSGPKGSCFERFSPKFGAWRMPCQLPPDERQHDRNQDSNKGEATVGCRSSEYRIGGAHGQNDPYACPRARKTP